MRIAAPSFLFASATLIFLAGCGGNDSGLSETSRGTDDAQVEKTPTTTGAAADGSDSQDTQEEASPSEDADSTSPQAAADSEFLASLEGSILFSSERNDQADGTRDDLYIMNADGSGVRRLTKTDRNEWRPVVADGGETLFFSRDYDEEEGRTPPSGHAAWGVFMWRAGSEPIDVTDNQQFQMGPQPSPDGSRLLVTSGRGTRQGFENGLLQLGETNVWVMDRDGSNAQQLTENDGSAASWSPDGSQIVFSGDSDGGESREIFIMNADGSGVRQVTDDEWNNASPAWSPDGSRIVYSSRRGEDYEVFVVNVDGSNPLQLTDNDADDLDPSWSPDGEAIVFTSKRDGNWEVYVMAADGSSETNVTNNSAYDTTPYWSAEPFEG
jgi:Tol biopolymer transport system component